MKPENLNDIRASFTVQAENFESRSMNFSKQAYLDYTVRCLELRPDDLVLEAAAGTCACGRAIAPFVRSVVCLDATPAMLAVGEAEAAKSGLTNMQFVNGLVEEMPFPDRHFDTVLSRLAFHHFSEIERPFSEMSRVLKPGGKLAIIDMEAAAEELRAVEDQIETLRDPSHVKNRSGQELLRLFDARGYTVVKQESTAIPVSLKAWLALTGTPEQVSEKITALMEDDRRGGKPTGFAPYLKDGEIYFDQRWLLIIGIAPGADG
jgi:ubiquinone/menaquinone biosynthesis C-methylase UbiE